VLKEVENTFEILANKGITREFLYKDAEKTDKFKIPIENVTKILGIKIEYIEDLKDETYNFPISGTSLIKGEERLMKINIFLQVRAAT